MTVQPGPAVTGTIVTDASPARLGDVVLRWYCGYYVGPCGWRGDFYEPAECGSEFDTSEDPEDVQIGDAFAICPKCGAGLTMRDDEPHVLYEGQDG